MTQSDHCGDGSITVLASWSQLGAPPATFGYLDLDNQGFARHCGASEGLNEALPIAHLGVAFQRGGPRSQKDAVLAADPYRAVV